MGNRQYDRNQKMTVNDEEQVKEKVRAILEEVHNKNSGETEFLQAVEEFVNSILPLLKRKPWHVDKLRSLVEPDRAVSFRVPWTDDNGTLQINRGFRIQFNNALGPYKGGLRFHPLVCQSTLKFLGFEQIFKNALTGSQIGGGKGGSDFNPKGRSKSEIRAFCQSFMTRLARHIGPETDVPAGDIGVGGREIGFLYGQYRLLTNTTNGVLTGKGSQWGGSRLRPEATGYGAVYFARFLLQDILSEELEGKKCFVSGSGNAAQYACEKLLDLGARVLTVSDSNGTLFFKEGMVRQDLEKLFKLKNDDRERLREFKEGSNFEYIEAQQPWDLERGCEIAFPSATQNEIDKGQAQRLIQSGCRALIEVANMPCTADALSALREGNVLYAPGKAANAGGVAVSAMEMSQNAARAIWTPEQVDKALQDVMKHIYYSAKAAAAEYGDSKDIQMGSNIAAFELVAQTMDDQGMC